MMKKICLIMLSVVGAQSAVAGDAITTGGGVANSLNVSTTSHTYIGNTSADTDIYGSQIFVEAHNSTQSTKLDVKPTQAYLYTTEDYASTVRNLAIVGVGTDSGQLYTSMSSGVYNTGTAEWVSQNTLSVDPTGVYARADTGIVGSSVILSRGTNSLQVDAAGTTVTGNSSFNGAVNNIGTSVASVNTIGTSGSTNNLVGTTNIGTAGGNTNIGGASSTNVILGSTSVTGTTTINSSGSSNTTIGHNGSGSGTVSLVSGPNSISVSSSENLIAGTNTIQGTTNINTTGSSATSIGNSSSTLTLVGSTVNVGANANAAVNLGTGSGSTVSIGSASGNSTVSFNGNRVQGVGNAVAGTDAVNLNQLNNAISSTNNAINGLQNQMNSAKAGIAGVTAATNLPGLASGQKYNFGVAWGNYMAYNGMALGGNAKVSENVTLKLSGSATSGVYSGGAGLAIGF